VAVEDGSDRVSRRTNRPANYSRNKTIVARKWIPMPGLGLIRTVDA